VVENELFIGSIEYLTLYRRCHIDRCRYKRVDCFCNYSSKNIYKHLDSLSTGVIPIKLSMLYFKKCEYHMV